MDFHKYAILLPKSILIFTMVTWLPLMLFVAFMTFFYLPILESIAVTLLLLIVIILLFMFQVYLYGYYTLTDIIIYETKIIIKVLSPFRKETTIEIHSIEKIEVSRCIGYFPFDALDLIIITKNRKYIFAYLPRNILEELNSHANIIFEDENSWHPNFWAFRDRMIKKHSVR